MNARRSLSAGACASTPQTLRTGTACPPGQPRFPLLVFLLLPAGLTWRWAAAGVQAGRRPPRRGSRALTPAVPSAHCPGLEARPPAPVNHAPQAHTEHDTPSVSPASPFPPLSTALPLSPHTSPPTQPAGEPQITDGQDHESGNLPDIYRSGDI